MSKRALTALLVLVAVAVAIGTVVLAREQEPTLTREALLTYQDAIHPPLAEGGRTVQEGMKPAVDDLRADKVPAAEVQGWIDSLTEVRKQVSDTETPDALREAGKLFVKALDQYLTAAKLFSNKLVDQGLLVARGADRTYDDASRILQDWRRRLGLGATAEFPDPTPTT